ncbi:MAG TPA: hypothetical protein VHC19_18935 [Pirellulales bacterium]|nr:hypothetical protein [Pirellulales bacterium]
MNESMRQLWPWFFVVPLLLTGQPCVADPPGTDIVRAKVEAGEAAPESRRQRELKVVLEEAPWVVDIEDALQGRGRFGNTASDGQFRKKLCDQLAGQLPHAAIVRGFAPILEWAEMLDGETVFHPLAANDVQRLAAFRSSPASERLRETVYGRPGSGPFYPTFSFPGERRLLFQARLTADFDDSIRPRQRKHVGFAQSDVFHTAFYRRTEKSPWRLNISQVSSAPADARPLLQEYAFLAPSVEEAKQAAQDFLDVYNHDFLPLAVELAEDAKAGLVAAQGETAPQLAELRKQVRAVEEQLEGVEELSAAAVSDLKVKRSLLKVELAGVEARRAAIEAKLKEGEGPAARLIEMKVAADIDLAGLAAQRKVLDAMIDGQSRLAELAQLREQKIRPLQERADSNARYIRRCDELLADLIPFQLVDDSIIIRPTKFE